MRPQSWEHLCVELGLTPWRGSRDGPVGFGELGPHEIRAGIWTDTHVPWAQLGLHPALDLGLAVVSPMTVGPQPPDTVPVGDPRLDPFLRLRADEPARARALFVPRIRDGLNALIECGAFLWIDDDGIVAEGRHGDIATFLRRAIAILSKLAGAFDDARVSVPPPRPLAGERDAWEALASEGNLQLQDTPMRLGGRLGDLALHVATHRAGVGTHVFGAGLTFEVALDLGLSLEPRGLLEAIATFATGDDVRLGDAVFDRTFVARARDPALLRSTLGPEVRGALVALREQVACLTLSDEGLALRGTLGAHADGQGVIGLLRMAIGALDALGANWRRSTGRWTGPYR